MATAIIILILIIIAIFSIKSYAKKLSSGCCGSGGDVEKKIRVRDKNPKHYSGCVKIGIDSMVCSKCKTRVENALNAEDGVWAEADLSDHSVTVRMKNMISEDALRHIISRAGYLATYVDVQL